MIFKENTSSSNELILPPITSTKTETAPYPQSKEEKVENENLEPNKESLINTELAKNPETINQSTSTSQNK